LAWLLADTGRQKEAAFGAMSQGWALGSKDYQELCQELTWSSGAPVLGVQEVRGKRVIATRKTRGLQLAYSLSVALSVIFMIIKAPGLKG
jgi:hypothetical protein